MQAIRSPEMETAERRRRSDAKLVNCRILVIQSRASQTSSRPVNNPLPRKVVAMPNTTPEKIIK